MKKSKFTGEQIALALRQAEVGTPVAEACRKMGVSEATYYRWKQLYGGTGSLAQPADRPALSRAGAKIAPAILACNRQRLFSQPLKQYGVLASATHALELD